MDPLRGWEVSFLSSKIPIRTTGSTVAPFGKCIVCGNSRRAGYCMIVVLFVLHSSCVRRVQVFRIFLHFCRMSYACWLTPPGPTGMGNTDFWNKRLQTEGSLCENSKFFLQSAECH